MFTYLTLPCIIVLSFFHLSFDYLILHFHKLGWHPKSPTLFLPYAGLTQIQHSGQLPFHQQIRWAAHHRTRWLFSSGPTEICSQNKQIAGSSMSLYRLMWIYHFSYASYVVNYIKTLISQKYFMSLGLTTLENTIYLFLLAKIFLKKCFNSVNFMGFWKSGNS